MEPVASPAPPSKVETIKIESDGLSGTIAASLASDATHFEEADLNLIKFHGSYQQDNRDERTSRKKQGLDKSWSYMIRCRIPGGKVTREQYLALDDIGETYTHDRSIRLTSRQGIQFHGIGRGKFKSVIRAVNDCRLTTLGACGDVNRNVMGCAVSELDWRAPLGIQEWCGRFAEHFAARSTAYWEIWCDGEKQGKKVERNREEPIYGKTYMPRKFKMALAVPEDNDVDLYTQDIGWEAVHDGKQLLAFDVIVGGGMGFSNSKEATYPHLGERSVRVKPEEVIEVAEAIFGIQRDFGDRTERSHARFKYVMAERGMAWFKEELFRRIGRSLPDAGSKPEYKVEDHLEWRTDREGKLYVGIHIVNGRVIDRDGASAKTGLREIVSRYADRVYITPKQNLVLAGIDPAHRGEVEHLLEENGLRLGSEVSMINRLAMACPALPLCGLALAEAERFSPKLIEQIEQAGYGDAPIEIRMTGCPNSCVRTPTAEIGVVGRGPGRYALYLGGNQQGTRLAFLFKETVAHDHLSPIIVKLIEAWQGETRRATAFGDWAAARGGQALGELLERA